MIKITTLFELRTALNSLRINRRLVHIKSKRKIPNKVITSSVEEIPLVTKGWTHNKSVGDYFVTEPNSNDFDKPEHPFEAFDVNAGLITALQENNLHYATSFQKNAINTLMTGKHTVLSAETGCGKTLAYLIPIINLLTDTENQVINQNILSEAEIFNRPKSIIIVPNRELAHQIGQVALNLTKNINLNVQVLVGGRTKRLMLNPNFAEIDILVTTPGVIGKLISVGLYKLNDVKIAVYDEFDTLIDDSFVNRTEMLLKRMPQAQLALVSATLPQRIPDVLTPYLNEVVYVQSPRLHKPLLNIAQKFLRLSKSGKPGHLLQIAKSSKDPLIIFSNKNETSNWVALFLRESGLSCSNINGDMNYEIRVKQWKDFSSGRTQILSATDVASRGLNTVQVRHILNYDFPLYAADYIHRVGRVGRLGSPFGSKVTNFISGVREIQLVQQIEMAMRKEAVIQNVDGNITKLVRQRISRQIGENI